MSDDRIDRNARIRELEALLRASEHTGVACAANVQRLEAELRDTKDTLEAVKHSNRELEAEVEKLREEMRAVEDGHRCQYRSRMETAEAEVERLRQWKKAYAKGRAGMVKQADIDYDRAEKAEAERDRLAEALRAIAAYDPGQDWYMQQPIDIARAALEGAE